MAPPQKRLKKPKSRDKAQKKPHKDLEESSIQDLNKVKIPFQELLRTYNSFTKVQDRLTCWATVVDEKGRVISWNKTAESISGYSRAEVLGNNQVWEWLYPDPEYRKQKFKTELLNLQESVVNQETTIITKDGQKKTISWHCNSLVDDFGQRKGVVLLGTDVTEQKKLEEQIRLREKMEGLARLAGKIAHNFNNTLSIIQGYVELVLEQIDYNHPSRGDLLEILDAVEKSSTLINQMLAFSKSQMINPIPLDLNFLIEEMEQVLKRTLGDQIELEFYLSPQLPTIKADPNQIQQALLNLAINAREAMSGTGKFSISTSLVKMEPIPSGREPLIEPGEYILLTVSDTSPGIDPKLRERIFEPFGIGSSGFNLSMVYGIVRQHSGYIWMESEPNKGTSFQIYLPISGKPPEIPKLKKLALELPKGQETILLVEDNDQMRGLAVRILRNLGYTVIETNSPKEALQILNQYPEPIHLLLLDVDLPEMTGPELAEHSLKIRPNLKALFFSGYSLDYLLDKKMIKPKSPLLAKPFSMKTLSQKVREILDQ